MRVDCRLQIQLLSDTCFGRGDSTVAVDTEVFSDSFGLPEIPGRTIRGLWRDATRELLHGFDGKPRNAWFGEVDTERLFGRPGLESGSLLEIGNGRLKEFEKLRQSFARLSQCIGRDSGSPIAPRPRRILETLTLSRTQTSRDRTRMGAPKEGTLRMTRFVRKSLEFYAPVSIEGNTENEILNRLRLLALSAAAIRRAGLGRNRGPGKVSCSLWLGETNLTEQYLSDLARPSKTPTYREIPKPQADLGTDEATVQTDLKQRVSQPNGTPSQIRFFVWLDEPALFPALSGNPNNVSGENFIPGPALAGAFARRCMQNSGLTRPDEAASDPTFQASFIRGSIRILNAYPAIISRSGDARVRTIPSSASLYTSQDFDERIELDGLEEEVDGLKPTQPGFFSPESMKIPATPDMLLKYHTARADDRRRGRATGSGAGEGALFTYTSLDGQQVFEGRILGTPEDLFEFLQSVGWFPEKEIGLHLGRSKRTQYGGNAVLTSANNEVIEPFSSECVQNPSWNDTEELSGDNYFTVILTSPVLQRDPKTGEPGPDIELLRKQIQEACCESGELVLEEAFVRYTEVGGFCGVAGFPRPVHPAYDAGSVFRFKPKNGQTIRLKPVRDTEWESLGERTAEGFGRFAYYWSEENPSIEHTESSSCWVYSGQPRLSLPPPEKFKDILKEMLDHYFSRTVRARALEDAQRMHEFPPRSTCSRLLLMFRDHGSANDTRGNKKEQHPYHKLTKGTRDKISKSLKSHITKVPEIVSEILAVRGSDPFQVLFEVFEQEWDFYVKLVTPNREKYIDQLSRLYYAVFFSALRKLSKS